MKISTDGGRAHELEQIVVGDYKVTLACGERDLPAIIDGVNRKLYVIDGESGLWRRIAMKKGTDEQRPAGSRVAWFQHGPILLVPAATVMAELRAAGLVPLFTPFEDQIDGDLPPISNGAPVAVSPAGADGL